MVGSGVCFVCHNKALSAGHLKKENSLLQITNFFNYWGKKQKRKKERKKCCIFGNNRFPSFKVPTILGLLEPSFRCCLHYIWDLYGGLFMAKSVVSNLFIQSCRLCLLSILPQRRTPTHKCTCTQKESYIVRLASQTTDPSFQIILSPSPLHSWYFWRFHWCFKLVTTSLRLT